LWKTDNQPALWAGHAFRADPRKPDLWLRRTKGAAGIGWRGARRCRVEVDLHHRGLVEGPDQRQQHRDRRAAGWRGSAWWIVASELGAQGAQVDQALRPRGQQPITAQLTSVQAARTTWWSITPGPRTRLTAQQERLPAGWLV
jgi:hypothetical protein